MTFAELQTGVFTRLNKSLTPDAVTAARIQQFLNDRYRELLRLPGIDLRGETLSIVTESGRARYALPATVTEIYNVTDTTNRILLRQTTMQWIRQRDPSVPAQQSGVPYFYALLNEAGIAQQPSVFTSGALRLISTIGADLGTVTIEYSMPNGGFQTVTTVLNGTNPVIVNAAVQYVFRIYMTAAPAGTVELFQTAPALTLARIPGGQTTTATLHAWVIHLWPTPGGPYAYDIDFDRPRRPLINPTDEPALPEEFHTTLVYGACAEESLKMDDQRASYYEGQYQADVKRLRAFIHQVRGQRLIPTGRGRTGFSVLGPFFPSNEGQAY
jgi:hypothetical protein